MCDPGFNDASGISAKEHYRRCMLREPRCEAHRLAGERGPCKAGPVPRLFRHRVEYSEESDLVPSHLFYLSGCDLRCVFCIAGINAFDAGRGVELTSEVFNEAIQWGRRRGAINIQWVGGEPTIHLPALLEIMGNCPDLPPVLWKSDFHATPEAMQLLNGVADVYIADFKFGNDRCARRLSGVEDYLAIVTRNLEIAQRQGRLIVRHLLLPGHHDCCFVPIVNWMQQHMPDVEFSLREGYLPSWRAEGFVELKHPLTRREIAAAQSAASAAQLQVIQ